MHNEDEVRKMCDVLHALFFKDAEKMFDLHFEIKWCSEKLFKFALASAPEMSAAFSRWSLNMPIEQRSTSFNLHDSLMHLPSLINFISSNASLHLVKEQDFFLSFFPVIRKIVLG